MGTGHLPAVLAPLAGAISSDFSKLLWEIYLFQNKGTEIMHRRNVNVCIFAASGLPHKFRQVA